MTPPPHLIITARYGENVSSEGPGDVPNDVGVCGQDNGFPVLWSGYQLISSGGRGSSLRLPDDYAAVLATRGDLLTRQGEGRAPGDIADPIGVSAFELSLFCPVAAAMVLPKINREKQLVKISCFTSIS